MADIGLIVQYVGGPTAVVTLGGVRLLLDPTFDPPGDFPIGERVLTKTQGPALTAAEVGDVDVVLLSHDQHPDNLDRAGRDYVLASRLVLSTASAATRIGPPVRALEPWAHTTVTGSGGGGEIAVTGVPSQHGPVGSEALVGEVTGFVLSGPGLATVYISGDNASLDVVRAIHRRLGRFDCVILFAGAARTALAGGAPLTLTSEEAAQAVALLGSPPAVLMHVEGWAHFSEGRDDVRAAFARHGLSDRLHLPAGGETIRL